MQIRIRNKLIDVKVAKSVPQKAKGYMFAKKPSKCEGILFVYSHEKQLCFWMPFVNFDLQLLFLKEHGTNKWIVKEKRILKKNDLTNICAGPYKLALELASCFEVKEGDIIEGIKLE